MTGESGDSSAVGGRPEGRGAQRRETEGSNAGEGGGGRGRGSVPGEAKGRSVRLGTPVPAGSQALVGSSRRGARPETASPVRVGCGGGARLPGPQAAGPWRLCWDARGAL